MKRLERILKDGLMAASAVAAVPLTALGAVPETGDENNLAMYIAMGLGAGAFIVLLLFNNKKKD